MEEPHTTFLLMLAFLGANIFALGYVVGASVHGVDEQAELDRRLARYDAVECEDKGRYRGVT
jgi:hypothetical protein